MTFPESYGVAELAGKPAEFETKIASIDAPKAATVDDEFAKRMGFESLSRSATC